MNSSEWTIRLQNLQDKITELKSDAIREELRWLIDGLAGLESYAFGLKEAAHYYQELPSERCAACGAPCAGSGWTVENADGDEVPICDKCGGPDADPEKTMAAVKARAGK